MYTEKKPSNLQIWAIPPKCSSPCSTWSQLKVGVTFQLLHLESGIVFNICSSFESIHQKLKNFPSWEHSKYDNNINYHNLFQRPLSHVSFLHQWHLQAISILHEFFSSGYISGWWHANPTDSALAQPQSGGSCTSLFQGHSDSAKFTPVKIIIFHSAEAEESWEPDQVVPLGREGGAGLS